MQKERFTNNTSILVKEAQKQLYTPENNDICLVFYAELSHFGNEKTFFLCQKQTNECYLVCKTWHKTKDFQKYTLGIYNLDRLNITTNFYFLENTQKLVFQTELNALKHVTQTYLNNIKPKALVLDGVKYQLKISFEDLKIDIDWYILQEEFKIFEKLVFSVKKNLEP